MIRGTRIGETRMKRIDFLGAVSIGSFLGSAICRTQEREGPQTSAALLQPTPLCYSLQPRAPVVSSSRVSLLDAPKLLGLSKRKDHSKQPCPSCVSCSTKHCWRQCVIRITVPPAPARAELWNSRRAPPGPPRCEPKAAGRGVTCRGRVPTFVSGEPASFLAPVRSRQSLWLPDQGRDDRYEAATKKRASRWLPPA